MNVLRWLALSAVAFSPLASWAEGDGISADTDRVPWARFQGRIALAATSPLQRSSNTSFDGTGLQGNGLSLMGDVYFGAGPAGGKTTAGGFRATSGVIVGARSTLWGTPAPHAIKVDLGIIHPEYVNIVVNGHEPMVGEPRHDRGQLRGHRG